MCIIIILRTQSEYILNMDPEAIASVQKSSRRREYIDDPMANELADEINQSGFNKNVKTHITALNSKQREGTLQALYNSMFKRKQEKVDLEGFKLKHGRGDEINHDILGEDDIELDEYAAAQKKGFNAEKMPNAKKMMYSSA